MSLTQVITVDDPLNFTYNSDLIDIVDNGRLKLLQDNFDFIETFDSDVGFTYDSAKTEFSGGTLQQKSKRPTDAIFYASFTNDENASWGNGTLTGSLGGSASVHDGLLDFTGGNAWIEYNTNNFSSMAQQGCIRFRWKPNYTGSAPSSQYILQSSPNSLSRIYIVHNSGYIQCYVSDSSGVQIFNNTFAFSAVSGQTYEFELNYNATSGQSRFFVNGVNKITASGTGTVNAPTLWRMGANSNQAFSLADVLVFDTVQHTSNYTPNWSNIYEYDYLGDVITMPEMQHVGVGALQAINTLTTTESNSPKYTLQVGRSGNYLYWDGADFAISDGSYAQANTKAEFNQYFPNLDVVGEVYGQFKIHFQDSNDQQSISNFIVNVLADEGYDTDSPTILNNSGVFSDGLVSFFADVTMPTDTDVRFQIVLGVVRKWFNGSSWETTTGGVEESNTWSEINTNLSSLEIEDSGTYVKVLAYLKTTDDQVTPTFSSASLSYNYYKPIPDEPAKCFIYGHTRDIIGELQTSDFTLIVINKDFVPYDETFIEPCTKESTADAFGEFQIQLIETESTETKYLFKAKYYDDYYQKYKTKTLGYATVPNLTEKALSELTFSTTP